MKLNEIYFVNYPQVRHVTGRQNTRHLSACATFYYMLDTQLFLQPHLIPRKNTTK